MPLHQSIVGLDESPAEFPTTTMGYLKDYRSVRATSEAICSPLADEDYVVQTMPDVSPPKWHLAHVTWFFETFLLKPYLRDYRVFNPTYDYLFNSYYQTHGQPFPRPARGSLSRPTVAEIYGYRHYVNGEIERLLLAMVTPGEEPRDNEVLSRLILGLHHEQQHQELLLMDIKHILAANPLMPVYRSDVAASANGASQPLEWIGFPDGLHSIGLTPARETFAFDNETPQHQQYLAPFWLANRPVTNREFMAFIEDGGYRRVDLWLSDGWDRVCDENWEAPLYWEPSQTGWLYRTLGGQKPVDPDAPVCHVSFYEAEAYARWAKARLPTEAEWEVAAAATPIRGNLLESDQLQPMPVRQGATAPAQMFGDVWEWTGSAYRPYPGFKPLPGSLGEYNGKFMSGQMVLRGGSFATPESHIRHTYRNFYPPHARWAFSGFRLARED